MSTRDADIKEYLDIIDDMSRPYVERKRYWKHLQDVIRQSKDRKLEHLRTALIKATQANDKLWMWKYQGQIKQYIKEEHLERPW